MASAAAAEDQHPKRTWSNWIWVGVAALVGAVVGGVIAYAVWSEPSVSAVVCNSTNVANDVVPSVVTIQVGPAGGNPGSTGSGEFYQEGGYILTNNHVIVNAADGGSLEVVLSDGQKAPATLVGRDTLTDLAVIKAQGLSSPKVIALGSSSDLVVGQPVVVVGAPLGLSSTVTSGIVSALDRSVNVPAEEDKTSLLADAIQTDAAINPGNSGGAMVNCSGQLVGVPSAGAALPGSGGGSIGLGFAIPVDIAKAVADEIIATGKVTHASFGLQVVPISGAAASQAGLPEGLFVTGVMAGGPSASAGLKAGDVITEINGQPAKSADQLLELTITMSAGDKVQLTYVRDGTSTTTSVTLG